MRQQLQCARHVQFIRGSKAIAFSLLMAYLYFARGQYVSANALGSIIGRVLICGIAYVNMDWAHAPIYSCPPAKQFLHPCTAGAQSSRGFTRNASDMRVSPRAAPTIPWRKAAAPRLWYLLSARCFSLLMQLELSRPGCIICFCWFGSATT